MLNVFRRNRSYTYISHVFITYIFILKGEIALCKAKQCTSFKNFFIQWRINKTNESGYLPTKPICVCFDKFDLCEKYELATLFLFYNACAKRARHCVVQVCKNTKRYLLWMPTKLTSDESILIEKDPDK